MISLRLVKLHHFTTAFVSRNAAGVQRQWDVQHDLQKSPNFNQL